MMLNVGKHNWSPGRTHLRICQSQSLPQDVHCCLGCEVTGLDEACSPLDLLSSF